MAKTSASRAAVRPSEGQRGSAEWGKTIIWSLVAIKRKVVPADMSARRCDELADG